MRGYEIYDVVKKTSKTSYTYRHPLGKTRGSNYSSYYVRVLVNHDFRGFDDLMMTLSWWLCRVDWDWITGPFSVKGLHPLCEEHSIACYILWSLCLKQSCRLLFDYMLIHSNSTLVINQSSDIYIPCFKVLFADWHLSK